MISAGTMHTLGSNHKNTIARLALTEWLLFQYGIKLGYYSNMVSSFSGSDGSGVLLQAN